MGDVHVFAPDGTYGTVDEKDLPGVEAAGGHVATKDEVLDQLPAVTGSKALDFALSLTPQQQAAAQGVMSGATLGFGQVGIKKLLDTAGPDGSGAKYVDWNKRITEAYPGATTAGEVTGIAASALLGNETGLARLLPGAMVARAGAGVEAAAAGGLSRIVGGGLGGEALKAGAKLAARGAMEGALYGGGTAVSEQLLGDHELAADKILTAMGHGALGGAAGGAAFGGGAHLVSGAASAASSAVRGRLARVVSAGKDAFGATEAAVEATAARAGNAVDGALVAAEGAARDGVNELGKAAGRSARSAMTAIEEAAGKPLPQLANDWAREAAKENAWKSLSPLKKFSEEAEARMVGGTKGVGEVLLKHSIIDIKGGLLKAGMEATPEKMLPKIQAAKELVGARIGDITSTSPATLTGYDINRAFDSVIDPLSKKAGFEGVTRSVRDYGKSLAKQMGLESFDQTFSVGKLLEQRKALDELVYKEAKALDPNMRVAALRDLRGKLEDLIVGGIDDAAKSAGKSGLGDELRALKREYQGLSIAEKATETTSSRMATNRNFSLSAYQAGGGVAAGLSGVLGFAAPVAGLAAGVGHQFLKDRGNAMASVALSRLAATETLGRMINSVDAQVSRSAKGLLTPVRVASQSTGRRTTESPRVRAAGPVAEVADAQADPERFAARVAKQVEPVRMVAPNVADNLALSSSRALGFLATKLPQQFTRGPLDQGAPPSARMTDQEAAKFLRYYGAVRDPMQAYRAMERGTLTPEAAEALKVTQPKLFADLQQQAILAIQEHQASGKPVPYDRRAVLSLLLDAPMDPSFAPERMRALQANVATGPQPGQTGPSPAGPSRPLKLPTSTQLSNLDSIESK